MDASNFKQPVPAIEEPHLDLYTIPSYSSWFHWGNIHEIERISLREFFDGSSVTRTPRIYKEYRDFIICKYREDPSRTLTFTDVRKSLVGDVSTLHKVFTFLEKWGLINFGGTESSSSSQENNKKKKEEVEDEKWRIRVEEGAPYGVRVVAAPNSLKPVAPPPPPLPLGLLDASGRGELAENGSKFPPLASYSDIYGELLQQQEKAAILCWNCKERCDSGHYEYVKEERFILCKKCFESGDHGGKSVNDFKFINDMNTVVWTEAETLLLLESVLKHGDDWDLVAQNVKTKSKFDCISKLLQLPFGDLMLGSALRESKFWDASADISSAGQAVPTHGEFQGTATRDHQHEHMNEDQQNGNAEERGPPQKRLCTLPILDASSSLMKQVARLSSVVGPSITASAADAAVAELCYENRCSREIFDDDNSGDESGNSGQSNEEERVLAENSDGEKRPAVSELQETSQKNVIPLTLRMRAATATSLGAAAAHAKLLADQEDREIEHLLAIVIETQMKKLQRKAKFLENLKVIMEKQHNRLGEFEEDIVEQRMSVLQEIFRAGIPRFKDNTSIKSETSNVLRF